MDIATLIGIVSGFALLISSIIMMGGTLGSFVNAPGLTVVIGGTVAATLIMQRLKNVLGAVGVAKNAFFDKCAPIEDMLPQIIALAMKARKEGLVALEGENIEDLFMARGVRLGVDGLAPEVIRATLTRELASVKERHDRGQKIFRFMTRTAPAMGLIGTLIGLVQMLQRLDDPSAIGPGMAVALLTTLYGAVLAFLFFGPIADKLEARTKEEVFQKQLAIAGVDSIVRGDNSAVIRSKLEAYLSPAQRESSEQKK